MGGVWTGWGGGSEQIEGFSECGGQTLNDKEEAERWVWQVSWVGSGARMLEITQEPRMAQGRCDGVRQGHWLC